MAEQPRLYVLSSQGSWEGQDGDLDTPAPLSRYDPHAVHSNYPPNYFSRPPLETQRSLDMREKRGSVPPAARYAVDAASSRGGSTLSLANTMQRRPQFPASMTGSASGNLTPYLSAQQSRESFRSQRSQGIPVSERRGPSASRTPSSVRQPTLLRPHSTATSIPEMIVESMADRPSQEDEQHDYAHYWDFAYQQGSPALEHPEPAAVPTLEYPLGNDEADFRTHEQTITPYSDSEMRLEPKTSTPSLRKPKPVVMQEGRAMHHTYQGPVYEKPKTLQTYPTPEVSDVSNNGLPPRITSRNSWRQSLRRSWSLGSFDFENRSDMTSSTFPSFSQLCLPGIDYEHDNYDQRGISTLSWIASESSGDHEVEDGNYAWPWRGGDPENPIPSSRHDSGILDKEKGPLPDTEREMRLSTIIPDPNIVGWDSEKDPENPMNWSMKRKKISIIALALFTFITPLASSMFAPAVPQLLVEFDISSRLLSQFVVSVYVLGFAVGPLIVSPMSEVYGRYPVYIVGYIGFIAFTIGCALATSMPMLIVFRFFAGCFGVTPVAIGGGTIADLFPKEQRGKFMGLWALGPMLGPMVGPIGGGYLAAALNWRWVFWVITMAVRPLIPIPHSPPPANTNSPAFSSWSPQPSRPKPSPPSSSSAKPPASAPSHKTPPSVPPSPPHSPHPPSSSAPSNAPLTSSSAPPSSQQ